MSSRQPSIVTLTPNPAVDRAFSVDSVEPERKLRAGRVLDSAGGGGINVARALRELGHDTVAVWARGGPQGDHLARLLDDDGVAHRAVAVGGPTRQNLIVFEGSTGRQFRFGFSGPTLGAKEADACLAAFAKEAKGGDFAVLSGSLPPGMDDGFYAEAAASVPGGCRVVLDSSGEALERGVEAGVFVVKPNVRELETLAGRRLSGMREVEEAAGALVDSGGAAYVVVSLGSRGAMLVGSDGAARVPSPPVEQVSIVGAGDSMVAGLVAGVVRGLTMRDALRLGVAAGAAAVACGATGLCRRHDVDAFFERTRLADLAPGPAAHK